ncbi:HNH endonuclease [Aeromonas media]|uniref:HNH endonuclease n=1 Tax=Aeromonas media TaxID=651 RepID=UPI00361F3AEF
MWETNPAQFSDRHRISEQQVDLLQCTGEHLHPKSEGGSNSTANIVAACKFCNQSRHREKSPLTASEYKRKVRSLSKKGEWHTSKILKIAQPSKLIPGKKG